MPPTPSEPLVLLARLGRPHGVRGALHIDLAGEHVRDLLGQKLLVCTLPETATPVLSHYRVKTGLTLARVEPTKGEPRYVQFREVNDRDGAAELTNCCLAAPLADMRALVAKERRGTTVALADLWYFEIVGLAVLDANSGKTLGSITAIEDLGRNTVVTVSPREQAILTHTLEIPLNYPHWQAVDFNTNSVKLDEWQHFADANAG